MEFKFNPFNDAGITTYEQYKLYPFLVFGTLDTLKSRIQQQVNQIGNGYCFAERLIILGERGIGKTSSLFFIKDMLKENGIESELFSRLLQDQQHLENTMGIKRFGRENDPRSKRFNIESLTQKPFYILIDFPDTIDSKSFKTFLDFIWDLMTHKNYNKINLIFAMNKSHFEKSFSYSEIFGKFLTVRLEKLDKEETEKLIESRLKLVDKKIEEVFSLEVLDAIFNYSKGIPRNIISACCLLIDSCNGEGVTKELAEQVLKEKYIDQVINDRVEDLALRRIYKSMVSILEKDFNGTSNSQEEYIKRVMELCDVGRNSIFARIGELVKFGVFNQSRGGYNKLNKIISFN